MQKLSQIYFKLSVCIIIFGCSETARQSVIPVIDIEPQIDSPVTLQASDIVTGMRYVALETTDSSLLAEVGKTEQKNGYLFIRDRNILYMFDGNGKYLRTIGATGEGPEEYVRLYDFDVDENSVYLYDGARRRILVYGYDSQYLKTVNVGSETVTSITHIRKVASGFLCYQNPMFLTKKYMEPVPDLILTDETGKETAVLHSRTLNIKAPLPFMYNPHFAKHRDKIFFYPPLQDTIFSVSEGKITPEIIINRGRYAVYPADLDEATKRRSMYERCLFINRFEINDKWLILHCEYKGNAKTLLMYDFVAKKLHYVSNIINDIDGTFDLFPFVLTENGMLDKKSSFEIIEENKIPESLKNIDADDNPVIRISELK